jgi:glycosyltransferase involved in cell wall biosynthesis
MNLKIAVDCYEVVEYSTGVGRVIDNVLVSLLDILPESHFYVFAKEKARAHSAKNVKQYVIPSQGGYFRWQNGPFFRELRKIRPDLLIASNYTLPIFGKWKSILFEYDVSFASHPEWFSKREAKMRKYLVKRSLKKSTTVVTGSEFSKNEIIRIFNTEPGKIKVLYYGVEDKFHRISEDKIGVWKEKKGLKDKKIIGFLGSIFNRRNLPLLVGSVNLLRREFPETVLYVIGKDNTHPSQNIPQLFAKDWIRWETNIPDTELPLFYSSIDAFAYLSEYEGFGLPPLEALACGTVSVLLNKTSLAEIYQDMAVMVDEAEPQRVQEALKMAMKDEKRKEAILRKFQGRRNLFSWEKTAQDLSLMVKDLAS